MSAKDLLNSQIEKNGWNIVDSVVMSGGNQVSTFVTVPNSKKKFLIQVDTNEDKPLFDVYRATWGETTDDNYQLISGKNNLKSFNAVRKYIVDITSIVK